ncbi:ArnT family glycosyltransferase [Pseudoalteromonas luteoviolacea]|uniref:ArnT family glycosyltransferase n=1 Tax=Pseudoalteromonas luteoviolacea TaxID=43657 RepID=UPI00114FA28C|nr:glycosyltransferase family 39 protein [Pseudoalteromonas luteoviolacea]TQF70775.1 glycosyltransferase family 39 protein [Pseudoalteromonas luteoviolacea]
MTVRQIHLWLLLAFALLLRLISLATYPLMDTTEARYGEMARLMVETGNWLTPQFDYGVPFWGKPPLFTWMSAIGIELFGLNEFAVRVPHWFAGVLTICLIGMLAKKTDNNPVVAAIVVATCGIFTIASGAVMTDMALTLALTMAMVGFYFCWSQKDEHAHKWGYVGFFGLACGLLAKGPVALVIMAIAVVPWLILQHGVMGAFKQLWTRFPILSGCGLMVVVAMPWYVMAEFATPGFLDYFIVGEHFNRFVVSGWEGDLYGNAHDRPRGTIWLFWLQSALPWSVVLPFLIWKKRNNRADIEKGHRGLFSFLIFWLISPLILFTLSGNILPAYVLPGVPAIGVLIAMLVTQKDFKWLWGASAIIPVVLMIALLVLNMGKADSRSDRILFEQASPQLQTFYVGKRPFSGQFYSLGQAKVLTDENALYSLKRYHLIGRPEKITELVVQYSLSCALELESQSGRALYTCNSTVGE